MITNLDPSSEVFLANLKHTQRRLQTAQRQITSGKKIEVPADDPDQIDSLLQLRSALQRNTQIKTNLARAKTEASTADGVLSSALQLLDRAVTLAQQGTNPLATDNSRASLADQVQSLAEQMVSLTRTTVEGRFIFSGDQDKEPTYEVDWSQASGVNQLVQVNATRRIEDPAGGSFAAARTAQVIFDSRNDDGTPAAGNVFNAFASLRTALLNNDEAGISTAMTSIRNSSDHVNGQLAFYGGVIQRIQDSVDFAGGYDTRLQTELSTKQDADLAQAAVELTQGNTALQAAMQAHAKLPKNSLFDFLG